MKILPFKQSTEMINERLSRYPQIFLLNQLDKVFYSFIPLFPTPREEKGKGGKTIWKSREEWIFPLKKAPLQPASSEGLYVCMYVCMSVFFVIFFGLLPIKLFSFFFLEFT